MTEPEICPVCQRKLYVCIACSEVGSYCSVCDLCSKCNYQHDGDLKAQSPDFETWWAKKGRHILVHGTAVLPDSMGLKDLVAAAFYAGQQSNPSSNLPMLIMHVGQAQATEDLIRIVEEMKASTNKHGSLIVPASPILLPFGPSPSFYQLFTEVNLYFEQFGPQISGPRADVNSMIEQILMILGHYSPDVSVRDVLRYTQPNANVDNLNAYVGLLISLCNAVHQSRNTATAFIQMGLDVMAQMRKGELDMHDTPIQGTGGPGKKSP